MRSVIFLITEDRHVFKDRDAMKADPQRVTAGMQEAVRAAMDELAKQFM